MFLEKLEIQGFKSFATKNILTFPGLDENQRRGLTAIVGPNGSGKSNVADAVRWALGEQSLRVLRGKKSEDVIFSGSDKKNRLNLAEVSLHFNNEDGIASLGTPDTPRNDNEESDWLAQAQLTLTRRLYRDGTSEYLLNNARARLYDVQIILAKANFGQKTYSVIGQGMVEGFLNTSLSERKEFFDEATGVKQYQIKRDSALQKLHSSLEHLEQAQLLLGEIKPRLNNLTKQMNKLQKRAAVEEELEALQIDYYSRAWQELNVNWQATSQQIISLEKIIRDKDKKLRHHQQALAQTEKNKSLTQEWQSLQQELNRWQTDRNQLLAELSRLQGRLEAKQEVRQVISSPSSSVLRDWADELKMLIGIGDLAEVKKRLHSLHQRLSEFLSGNKPAVKDVQAEKQLTELKQKLQAAELGCQQAQARLSVFGQEQEQKTSALLASQKAAHLLQTELNQLNGQLNELKIKATRLETRLEDLEGEIRQNNCALSAVKTHQPSSELDLATAPERLIKLRNQLALIGGIEEGVEIEFQETKERHDFLQAQITDLRAACQQLESLISELDHTIKDRFDAEFKIISEKFSEYFKILFNGGAAKIIKVMVSDLAPTIETEAATEAGSEATALERVKYLQKYNSTGLAGIEIQATPPGKKIKNIAMLSGGERALVAIALICAIIAANPAPFVVLDEVDAALDESNSERLAQILDDLSKQTQFIVITHNRATMRRAKILYGVTMQSDGVSKLLSVKLEDIRSVDREGRGI